MKILLLLTIFFAGTTAMAQKENAAKSAEWWKQEYETREKNAPKDAQEKLATLRKRAVAEKWSFEIGCTDVFSKNLAMITGFRTPTEDYIKANPERIIPAAKFQNLPVKPNFKNVMLSPGMPYFDGNAIGIVTPARDQHVCGSCWAFAAMGAFETSYLFKNGGDPASLDLSEQQVLDCSVPFGCIGELTSTGIEYIANHFIQTESVYPYSGSSVPCSNLGRSMYAGRSWGWVGGSLGAATAPSVATIKQAICDHGSVVSAFYASDIFQLFRGTGVYNHDDHNISSNHVVQIIGWDDSRSAWLIKNSWGPGGWGNNGIGWVSYDMNHIGAYACWIDAESPQPVAVVPAAVLPAADPDYDFERNLPANNIYKIQNVQSGKMVEVKDGCDLLDKGLKVQQYENHGPVACCDGKNQEWLFIPAGLAGKRPSFYIINNGFMRVLVPGVNLSVHDDFATEVRWFIEPHGDVFFLRSVASNLYMEITDGNTDNSEWMKMRTFTGNANQQFRFTKLVGLTGPQNEYTYGSYINICPATDTHKAINIPDASVANGATIKLYDGSMTAVSIQWRLERSADGYYKFINRNALKCIDVTGMNADDGNVLVSWDPAKVEKQKWLVIPVARDPGNYVFFDKVSGKCMSVQGGGSRTGSMLETYRFKNEPYQKWKLLSP